MQEHPINYILDSNKFTMWSTFEWSESVNCTADENPSFGYDKKPGCLPFTSYSDLICFAVFIVLGIHISLCPFV